MHFIELGLPLVLLTVLGLERTTRWARDLEAATEAVFPPETPELFVNRPCPGRDQKP